MGITDREILRAEKFGSRDYEVRVMGKCGGCGRVVMSDEAEACRDGIGNLFCTTECFCTYYGLKDAEGRM